MNPLLTLLTDHNPTVCTVQPSPKIPDLQVIMAGSPPIAALTPEAAALLQGAVTQASVVVAHSLTPARPKRATGKGHRFKDGYSPKFLLLRAALHAYTDIDRLCDTRLPWHLKVDRSLGGQCNLEGAFV
jgi:hypothetical protein